MARLTEFPSEGWCPMAPSLLGKYLANKFDQDYKHPGDEGYAWNGHSYWRIDTSSSKQIYSLNEIKHFYTLEECEDGNEDDKILKQAIKDYPEGTLHYGSNGDRTKPIEKNDKSLVYEVKGKLTWNKDKTYIFSEKSGVIYNKNSKFPWATKVFEEKEDNNDNNSKIGLGDLVMNISSNYSLIPSGWLGKVSKFYSSGANAFVLGCNNEDPTLNNTYAIATKDLVKCNDSKETKKSTIINGTNPCGEIPILDELHSVEVKAWERVTFKSFRRSRRRKINNRKLLIFGTAGIKNPIEDSNTYYYISPKRKKLYLRKLNSN